MTAVSLPADAVNAFIVGPEVLLAGAPGGPLAGTTFAAKDLFDVRGHRTGAGNPDWWADAPPATTTAPAVERLVAAGATLLGKTHTDELAYSIAGTNIHYGTPVNVAAPGRIPGGSSSGSAAAVAAGLVDFALGTDTGGSVRVPASYCGIFGLRPSRGRVPVHGLMPLSASYDTAGPFARDPSLLATVAAALFGGAPRPAPPVDALVLPTDAWAEADADTAAALEGAVRKLGIRLDTVDLASDLGGLEAWVRAFRTIQGAEAWAAHGGWISSRRPAMGPGVAARFEAGAKVSAADLEAARPVRQQAATRLADVLAGARLLAIPSTSGPAPTPEGAVLARADVRERTLRLTCIAGHAGAPVVSIPLTSVDGLPVGLSLVGTPGQDEQVLRFTVDAWASVSG